MGTPVNGGSLLFVAAEPREFGGILRHCTLIRKLRWSVDWARSAELNGRRILLAANGAGGARAAGAVEAARSRETLAAVVSAGFCGALDPALQVGSVFVASAIEGSQGRYHALAPQAPSSYASGLVASINHIAQTSEEKHRLRATGAAAVEMEAAGVAEAASRAGLDVYCVRSVTDLLEETFSNDFNAVLRPDGHLDTIDLLASAIRKPAASLPELFRLHHRCRLAAHTLGEFIANCRF